MQRIRLSVSPIVRATAAVPSGELSSTNTTSQSHGASKLRSRSTRIGTFALSLKVGTTMQTSGAGRIAGVNVGAIERAAEATTFIARNVSNWQGIASGCESDFATSLLAKPRLARNAPPRPVIRGSATRQSNAGSRADFVLFGGIGRLHSPCVRPASPTRQAIPMPPLERRQRHGYMGRCRAAFRHWLVVAHARRRRRDVLVGSLRRDRAALRAADVRRRLDLLLCGCRPRFLGFPLAQHCSPPVRLPLLSPARRALRRADGRRARRHCPLWFFVFRCPAAWIGCDFCGRPIEESHLLRFCVSVDRLPVSAGLRGANRNVDGTRLVLAHSYRLPLRSRGLYRDCPGLRGAARARAQS